MNETPFEKRLQNWPVELALGVGLLVVGWLHVLAPILRMAGVLSPVNSRDVRIDATAQVPDVAAAAGVALRSSGHAELVFTDPDAWQRLQLGLPGLVNGLLVIVILVALLQMARTFRNGDFFVPQNTLRLAVVAGALVLMGFLVPLLDMMTTNLLARHLPMAKAITPAMNYAVLPAFLAMLVGAVAGAFHAGTRLRADTEGLV